MNSVMPGPVRADVDLRDMVRRHLIRRSLECMDKSAERRARLLKEGRVEEYRTIV